MRLARQIAVMMAIHRLALTAHEGSNSVIAYRPTGPVTLARFLADVRQVAALLPAGGSFLNMCEDRYRFMVGLAAGLVADKVSLLPASHTPETVRRLKEFAGDLFCLHDGKGGEIDLPQVDYPRQPATTPIATAAVPEIDEQTVAAYLFTSGSTGTPMAHRRTWGAMVRNGRAEAERLGFASAGYAIVGTVPAQHSYGFESTVLLSLFGNCAAWSGRPFYPADIAAALAAVPRPRLLVTTPFHLRALLDSGVEVPTLDMLLSATAPLSESLAREAETKLSAPLYEIYGCTESGQLASRRTSATRSWAPFSGVRLDQDEAGNSFATGGHVEGRVPLSDVLELQDDGSFLLHGRHADMINIAGKRTSLTYLNHQLSAIAQVEDGCFFMPDEAATASAEGITRLCAFVVAPTLTAHDVIGALRSRIDPIFLPRPLVIVDRLPRTAAGKLPRSELQALLDRYQLGTAR
jgi:acyl-coenzyme A synthetase/AMP-(fatty) acid ligase